jgi:hypothetical protein
VLNPGPGTATGTVGLGLTTVPFSLTAGAETHVTFPAGSIGGPVVVTVTSGPAVRASQRVQYYQSFNEVWAMSPAQADTTLYAMWFDKATPGMLADNIHIINPGLATANVLVKLAGAPTQPATVPAGGEAYVSFPKGSIGGPVTITSDQPVLAASRVQYYKTFNEVVARSANLATMTSYFNWFDKATPGMVGDNIHVFNPGATVANVTVTLGGAPTQAGAVAAGTEGYFTFPAGSIGGPVTVGSDQPVLTSQRVQYFQSFNEVAGEVATQASMTDYIMWFDKASPGMFADNIHILNVSGSTANVTIMLAGQTTLSFSVPAGAEAHATFPGGLGGPVTIGSNVPVLAAARVQYYSTFNEVPATS